MPDRIRYQSARPAAIRGDETTSKAERDRFYGSARWRKLRAAFLSRNPLCARCTARGETSLARVVHHVKERLAFPALAYATSNLEPLCNPCHTADHKRGG